MWSKYLSPQGDKVTSHTLMTFGREDGAHHQHTTLLRSFDLPSNGQPPRLTRTSASELQDVVVAFSQRDLFDAETLAEANGRHAAAQHHMMTTATDAARQQLPAAPRRPPVVEWLLTSMPINNINKHNIPPHDGDLRGILTSSSSAHHHRHPQPHAVSVDDDEDAMELQDLLEALDAASPLPSSVVQQENATPHHQPEPAAHPSNSSHLFRDSPETLFRNNGDAAFASSLPMHRDVNQISKQTPRHSIDASRNAFDTNFDQHGAGSSHKQPTDYVKSGQQHQSKPTNGPRLTSDSFARLGVIPPRTGSAESLDGEYPPQYAEEEEAHYIHVLDMDAVRRALHQPARSDSAPGSPQHQSSVGEAGRWRSAYQHPSVNMDGGVGGHHNAAADGYHRDPVLSSLAIPLMPEEKDLLQRGFQDLAKRRSACNAKAIKTRLYDAPTTPRRRIPR